jgi:hypothetical protein
VGLWNWGHWYCIICFSLVAFFAIQNNDNEIVTRILIGQPGANLIALKFATKVGHTGGGCLDCGYKDGQEVGLWNCGLWYCVNSLPLWHYLLFKTNHDWSAWHQSYSSNKGWSSWRGLSGLWL